MFKSKISIYKIIFSVILVSIVLFNIGKLNQICVIDDEFGYWGVGAYFAGYDWTGLTPTSPYYGYGLGFIYMFLFKVFNDVTIMYKAAIMLNAVFLLVSFYLSTKCFERVYPEINQNIIMLVCAFIALYPNTIVQSQVGWTESALYLWFWVVVALVIKIWDKATCINCSALAAVLMYGYMIHQRTLGIIISGAIIFIMLGFLKKVSKKHVAAFIVTFGAFILIAYCIKTELLASFWIPLDVETANLNNIGGQVGKIKHILSLEGIGAFILSCLGKALYLIFSTYGLIIVAFVSVLLYTCKLIQKLLAKKKQEIFIKEVLSVFLFLAFVSTFAIAAIFMIFLDARIDILLYGRYTEFMIAPLLVVACLELVKKGLKRRYILFLIEFTIIISGIVGLWVWKRKFAAFHGMNAVGIANFYSFIDDKRYELFAIIIIIFMIINVAYMMKYVRWKNHLMIYFAIGFLMVMTQWYTATEYNKEAIYNSQKMYAIDTKETAEYIRNIGGDKNVKYVIAEDNTGVSDADLYDRNIKYVQFYLYDKKIDCVSALDISQDSESVFLIRKASDAYATMCSDYELLYENNMYAIFR